MRPWPDQERFRLDPYLLEECAARHARLCPRQVLGLRIGLLGTRAVGLEVPRSDKRLLVIVETDGCAADGIIVATGCEVGRRTLRVIDYGKVAATFIDVETEQAVRVFPQAGIRERAARYAPQAPSTWHAQLRAYQIMPDQELLAVQPVVLTFSLKALIGEAGQRAVCDACGEEIINQREVTLDGKVLCRSCAGNSYYAVRANGRLSGTQREIFRLIDRPLPDGE